MKTPLRVLVVEDLLEDAELLVKELSRGGFEVDFSRVETPEEMRRELQNTRWDVVVSDYSLPSFNGLDAFRLLREFDQETPFILVSGTVGEEVAVLAMRSGVQDYLLKSSLTRLPAAVFRELSEAEARRARRRAEETLAHERHFLRALLDTLTEGIIACDASGARSLVNRATREMFGSTESADPLELDGAVTLYERNGQVILPRDREPLHRAFMGEVLDDTEIQIVPRGHKPRSVVASGRPILDENGRKIGAVVAMHDVTDRRLLEAQFRQSQKMEALGRLAGGVAHDFNNLLTAILGYAELLLLKTGESSPMSRDLHEIRKAGERAAALTRQLLAFSRRQVVEPQIVDLNAIVRESERMLGRLIGEDVQLSTVLSPGLHPVLIDPGQIEQVLLNVVVNARDAMPEGGRLILETANVSFDDDYVHQHVDARVGPHAMLAVTDTGTGISPEAMTRMFEPFFTTKEKGKGTGLGLATVYGIVHQAGGHIVPYSEIGRGTVFKIYFPMAVRAKKTGSSGSSRKLKPGERETILLCEDDRAVSHLARRVLEDAGFAVIVAASGEEALAAAAKRERLHLLLTDTVLPGMTGPQLIAELRASRKSLPAILMSGYTEATVETQGGALPRGILFLQKPFAPAALLERVRHALEKGGARST